MIQFEDACVDGELYAVWLTGARTREELAEQAGRILHDGGYTVTQAFVAALSGLEPLDLADFAAANSPFETDDHQWLENCRRRYPPASDPSETAQQRNGARATWRI